MSAARGTVVPVSSSASAPSPGSVRLAPEADQRAGGRSAAGGRRAPVRVQLGTGPGQGEPGPVGRGGQLRHPQGRPDPAVLVLRPGPGLGRGQAHARAVAYRAFGADVPVRHPPRAHGTLPLPEGPGPVPQVQGPAPGPATVHGHRRSAPAAWSPADSQIRVGRPGRAVPGAGQASAAAGPRPGSDTEHHRKQGPGRLLVRVGVLRTHHDSFATDVQPTSGCRGRGGRRGQDRSGRRHR